MWSRVSLIDYLLAIASVIMGKSYYISMRKYFLGRVRFINYQLTEYATRGDEYDT